MKPPEILGMIEEAAGTRMFENKKEAALKTIQKKQGKVDEINKVPPVTLATRVAHGTECLFCCADSCRRHYANPGKAEG